MRQRRNFSAEFKAKVVLGKSRRIEKILQKYFA